MNEAPKENIYYECYSVILKVNSMCGWVKCVMWSVQTKQQKTQIHLVGAGLKERETDWLAMPPNYAGAGSLPDILFSPTHRLLSQETQAKGREGRHTPPHTIIIK